MIACYNRGSCKLDQLSVGEKVPVQNQTIVRGKKWDRTGTIVEILPFRKYRVRIDGGGRTTVRNRRFLIPIPSPPHLPPRQSQSTQQLSHKTTQIDSKYVKFDTDSDDDGHGEMGDLRSNGQLANPTPPASPASPGPAMPPQQLMTATPADDGAAGHRRPVRQRNSAPQFQALMRGKSHA